MSSGFERGPPKLPDLPYDVLRKIFIYSRNPNFRRISRKCYLVTLDVRDQSAWLLKRKRSDALKALKNALLWSFCTLQLVETLEHIYVRRQARAVQRYVTALTTRKRPRSPETDPNQPSHPFLALARPPTKRTRLAASGQLECSDEAATSQPTTLVEDGHTRVDFRPFYRGCRLSRRFFQRADSFPHVRLLVKAMLARGVPPDEPSGYPLVKSARLNNTFMVKLLLKAGADPDLKGPMPLRFAAGLGHYKIVRLLLKYGPQKRPPDSKALQYAVANNHIRIAELLLQHGAVADMETLRILDK
ncbi:hypothetical protein H4R34_004625 [Dimargaris verticillata]|uniref:F-box domain-containing protein n=1 Tax=Dimargaris verticillata TaxID=2761393 RepID=A0A9W8B569_9FUNG|nr:hypothetical protein H4R34_004625 [Dimargaris verticillata]